MTLSGKLGESQTKKTDNWAKPTSAKAIVPYYFSISFVEVRGKFILARSNQPFWNSQLLSYECIKSNLQMIHLKENRLKIF